MKQKKMHESLLKFDASDFMINIILEFDGVKLTTNSAFSALVNTASKYQIGSTVEITYYSRSSNSILKTTITLKGE